MPELHLVPVNGIEMAAWVWPGADPPILFAHCTGFHGRAWDQIAELFPDRRRIAAEFRGHGRSTKHEPPYPWRQFGADLAALAEAWNLRGALGVGHSMGGHSTVCAASLRPETYSALVLVDPTIFSPDRYGTQPADASFIERRRNVWSSWKEMYDRFAPRPHFSRWRPEALRSYCEFGVLPEGDHFVLACPPHIEASIYFQSKQPASNLYPEIARIEQPVTVIRAGKVRGASEFDLSASPTGIDLASYFPRHRDVLWEDLWHYIPMEAPERVAAEMARAHF
jgi:pimeloyl-ACP methyl ester carboxylesterase